MVFLDKNAIFACQDLPSEDVAVPEWGGVVRVRCLTGDQRDQFDSIRLRCKERDDLRGVTAWLVALSCVDSEGNRLFGDEDVPALARKSGRALDRLYQAAVRLSGLAPEALEQAAKNSASAPSGEPGSG